MGDIIRFDPEDPPDIEGAISVLFRAKMRQFIGWAEKNWITTPKEAESLTKPTTDPVAYSRGYAEGIAAMKDALDLWLDEEHDGFW